ncbi:Scr1 family TA system antitoxin-like transcriptional regulator [Actinoallomurus sp. NPDC052274]|uniref:helix-turn-helix domain-containing protein n=1 Tax=Actinoallomurus sp. NPDC052274 TaxID=3155420 RepID=UPI0034383639
MRTPPSPILITLGRLVRRYRDAASILQADLAKRLGYSDGWLSNVETGQLRPRREHITAIEQALTLPPGVLMEVYDLLEGESLPVWMRDWLGEERRSSALRAFELALVPGLLQTPDYARSVLDGDEAALTARIERQAILKSENPPTLRCVLDETVLTRGFGDAKVAKKVGAASTKSRQRSTAECVGCGERDRKVYERNRLRYTSSSSTSSNSVDMGWVAVRTYPHIAGGELRARSPSSGFGGHGELSTVVAVAMPQGYSRVPNLSTG